MARKKEEKIKATVTSFSNLLTKTEYFIGSKDIVSANRFELPEFQRGFVWGKEQICRLINSIKEEDELYIGNIVTAPERGGFDYLIDGQQRLVTLSILCLVLKNKAKSKDLKNEIDEFLYKNPEEPRIIFSKKQLNAFYKKIFNDKTSDLGDESAKFLKKAVVVIEKETRDLSTDKKIKSLLAKIRNIKIVVIKCLSLSELSRLFVGLNSTGLELSQVELIKGYLHDKVNSVKDKTWNDWIAIEKLFERNKIFWFNQFLRHQWYLVGGYVTTSALSRKINSEKIKRGGGELSAYIEKLKRDSKIYIALRNNKTSELRFPKNSRGDSARQISSIINDIHCFGLQQIYPVILALYNYGDEEQEYHKNRGSLNDFVKLWSFLLLARYSKINPSSYEKIFANYCFDISKPGIKYEDFKITTRKFFITLKSKVELSKEKFAKELSGGFRDNEDKFTKIMFYDLYDFNGKFRINNFEVEHILPKGKNGMGSFKEWQGILETDYEKLRGYIYKLGNLSILESDLNNSAANHDFEAKKRFFNSSSYDENKKIQDYDFSTAEKIIQSIDDRGKYLAENIFDMCIKRLNE